VQATASPGCTYKWSSNRANNDPKDGKDHVLITETIPGREYRLAWEDSPDVANGDFKDLIAVVRVLSNFRGAIDASTGISIDKSRKLFRVDEINAIRLYNRAAGDDPIKASCDPPNIDPTEKGCNFSVQLDARNNDNTKDKEVDIEASARDGNLIYWMGSLGNKKDGDSAPSRNRFFATQIDTTGTGATLKFIGYYDMLRDDLIDWDGHTKNRYIMQESAKTGDIENNGIQGQRPGEINGFNIEGLAIAPNRTRAYLGFRAPLVQHGGFSDCKFPGHRTHALIVPVRNFFSLVNGHGPAVFGDPIELDLGG